VVLIETVLLSGHDGALRFRVRSRALDGGERPDAVAQDLAGLDPRDPASLLHSTSWRFGGEAVVLTYVGLRDPAPDGDAPAVWPGVLAAGSDPLTPTPRQVSAVAVARHACEHLAYLRYTDTLVAACASAAGDLWRLIDRFTPAPAGLLTPTRGGWLMRARPRSIGPRYRGLRCAS
jgi:hypothetical protein